MPSPAETLAETRAERRAMVAELTRDGFTLDQIAERLGVTHRTVSRDRLALGIAQPAVPSFTDDEYRRARALIDDGYSLMEVARTLHRDVNTICKRFKGQGWTPAQTGQYNALRGLERRVLGE